MESLVTSIALKYAKSKGLDYISKEAEEYAKSLLGLDQQPQNPKYAISMGGKTIDVGNMFKKQSASQGIKSLMGGNFGKMGMAVPLIAGGLGLAYLRNPLRPGSMNYMPGLQQELNFAAGKGYLTRDGGSGLAKYGGNSILSGQNAVSMFGTNSYIGQLEKHKDKYQDTMSSSRLNQLNNEIAEAKGFTPEKNKSKNYGPYSGGGNDSSNGGGGSGDNNSPDGGGSYCFDPSTPIQMADGSEKKIKNIKLGDDTKGGEVTGVFQFKASDEIHNYKDVTVAGSHYVKEDGRFIMVKDSPLSVKIDKIPVVYSLDTSGRRIFINNIEFADYNGDGVAKNFLTNAGVDLTGFDTEVLRQVENRLI